MGTQLPSPKRGQSPQFSAHVYCAQIAGWIKMPLGMEEGLDPSDIVLDRDSVPPLQKGAQPPIFSPYLLCPNGWVDQDTTWYGGRPRPRPHCAVLGPSSPPKKGAQPPILGPCLLWPNGRPSQLLQRRNSVTDRHVTKLYCCLH